MEEFVVSGQNSDGLKKIKAVVGLGNPGSRYVRSRHNIGFMIINKVAELAGLEWHKSGDVSWALLSSELNSLSSSNLLLLKPMTFMNNSGVVTSEIRKKGISLEETLVIHDELEKPFGFLGFYSGGSARGHNGLRSIIERWGSEFWRLRTGIGRPDDKAEVARYVLSNFSLDEQQNLDDLISKAASMFTPIEQHRD